MPARPSLGCAPQVCLCLSVSFVSGIRVALKELRILSILVLVQCSARTAHTLAAHDEVACTLLDVVAGREDVQWLSEAAAATKEGPPSSGAGAAARSRAEGEAPLALAVLQDLFSLSQVGSPRP